MFYIPIDICVFTMHERNEQKSNKTAEHYRNRTIVTYICLWCVLYLFSFVADFFFRCFLLDFLLIYNLCLSVCNSYMFITHWTNWCAKKQKVIGCYCLFKIVVATAVAACFFASFINLFFFIHFCKTLFMEVI